MSHQLLRSLISEMVETYLEESSSDEKYRRAIHTGELPKVLVQQTKKQPPQNRLMKFTTM